MDMQIFKKSRNLLDLQKELIKSGELVNETTTDTKSENVFGNLMLNNKIKVTSNFMLNNLQFDFKIFDYPILIEIDGEIHEGKERRQKDYVKDRMANAKGFRVLRFTNDEVKNNQQKVLFDVNNLIANIGKQPRIVYIYSLSILEQIQYWYAKKMKKPYNLIEKFKYLNNFNK